MQHNNNLYESTHDYEFTRSNLMRFEKILLDYIDENNIKYVYADKMVKLFNKEDNLSKDNIEILIGHLLKKGILVSENNLVLRVCPICKTNTSILECNECGSTKIASVKKILHKCGYLGDISAFLTGDKFVCPQCNEDMVFGNEDEYRFSDDQYQCLDCNSLVYRYNKLDEMNCMNCNNPINNTLINFVVPSQVKKV